MADSDTAVLEPIAETVVEDVEAPEGETEQVESTETDAAEEAETEIFTREQVEAEKQAVAEQLRAEIEEKARTEAQAAAKQQVNQQWQAFAGDFGMDVLRKMAYFGAQQVAKNGHDPDEVAGMVAPVHAKAFLDQLKNTAKPYLYAEAFEEISSHAMKTVDKRFPEWKPGRDVEARYREATNSQDAAKAIEGLVGYLLQAIEDNEVPERVKNQLGAVAKKQQSAKEVEALRKTSSTGPAKVAGGSPGRGIGTMSDADAAYNRGELSGKQYAEYAQKFGVSLG